MIRPDIKSVLHPAARITFFQTSQWDPSVAPRARQLLLDIVNRYARADRATSPTQVETESAHNSTSSTSIFAMAMALEATPASKTVAPAVDGKDEVDLYCGNISPVAASFDDPLAWWKVSFSSLQDESLNHDGRRMRAL
jgi:hypothetical protein